MKIEQWLNSQLGIDIWNNKYKFEDETFEEWLVRVSNGNKDIAELIRGKRFLFGGRILANRGLDEKGKKVTYSNCYVLNTDDSIEDIYKTSVCPLAKTLRYELRKRGVKHLKCVYSKEEPAKPRGELPKEFGRHIPASVAFCPSVMGIIMASEITKDLIKDEEN